MEIDKKKPKSVVGIIPSDSAMGSTLLKKNVGPTSMTRGVFAVVDKLIKENPALADEFLKQVQWHEDHTKRVGRKAELKVKMLKNKQIICLRFLEHGLVLTYLLLNL